MPAALTSTPFKIGAFTAVSSAFGAGLVAIALTYTVPPEPFGGAPVFEVELFRDVGMSAPASLQGGAAKAAQPVTETAAEKRPETPIQARPDLPANTPTAEPLNFKAPSTPRTGVSIDRQANLANMPASRFSAQPSVAGSAVTGDDRRGAPTQGAQGGTQSDDYEAQVIRWLDAHKRHPGRLQGVVTVKFDVDRRGRIRDCIVTKSSGDERLDRIAQRQVQQAAPLPRPPHDVTWQTREITVSLDYRRHV